MGLPGQGLTALGTAQRDANTLTKGKVYGAGGAMLASFGSIQTIASVLADHVRGREYLAQLCGLEDGRTVEACGNTWCNYFDDEQHRCGLLRFGVHQRMGDGALKWFVMHRTVKPLGTRADNDALAMRVGVL